MIQNDLQNLAHPITELQLLPGNPRRGDIEAVKRSLEAFGQRKPIVVRRSDSVVIAGNHTLQAAQALGWVEIAVVWVDDDEVTSKAFALADNRTSELGDYDEQSLADLINDVGSLNPGLLESSGWDDKAVNELLKKIDDSSDINDLLEDDKEQKIPLLDQVPEITKPKDIWILGNHRLMCGDCRDEQDVNELIKEIKINIAFTSPPYAEQRKYDEKSGFKPIHPDQYVDWFENVASNVKKHSAHDMSWFVNIKPAANDIDTELYVFDLVLAHVRKWGWHFGTEYCWERNGVPKNVVNRFRNGFEPVYQFTLGKWKMRPKNVRVESNNVPMSLGKGSGNTSWSDNQGSSGVIPKNRRRKNGSSKVMSEQQCTNVAPGEYISDGLAYPNNRLPTFSGSHEAVGHTAAFPVGLPAWFIRAYTDENDFVYDPFCGSGSTILAADQEKRIGFGMEISPRYVDLICARYQKHTGVLPVLESSGKVHDFLNA